MRMIDYLFYMAYRAFQKKDPLGRSVIYITLLFNCFIWPLSAFLGILISNAINKDVMIIPALVLCFSSLWYFNSKYSQIESRIKKKNNYRGKDYYILFFIYLLLALAIVYLLISAICIKKICNYYDLNLFN